MDTLKYCLMLLALPGLTKFSSQIVHEWTDVNASFTYETMHYLSLEASKLRKIYIIIMVGDDSETLNVMFRNRSKNSFKWLKEQALSTQNMFLKKAEERSPGFRLMKHDAKTSTACRLLTLLGEQGRH